MIHESGAGAGADGPRLASLAAERMPQFSRARDAPSRPYIAAGRNCLRVSNARATGTIVHRTVFRVSGLGEQRY